MGCLPGFGGFIQSVGWAWALRAGGRGRGLDRLEGPDATAESCADPGQPRMRDGLLLNCCLSVYFLLKF